MLLKQKLLKLATNAPKQLPRLKTEEATKHTLILPFLDALGFNVFDTNEIIPEFVADIAGKQGEKVDYALRKEGKTIILIECKAAKMKLIRRHKAQLARYFHCVDDAVIAILTNGIHYRFYTDLVNPNKLDSHPFFEFNLLEINENHINELESFTKEAFDAHKIVNRANELTYTKRIQQVMVSELSNPSHNFIRFFLSQVYDGRKTQTTIEWFSPIVKQALHQLFLTPNEQLSSILSAKEQSSTIIQKNKNTQSQPTDDELAGYQIIKSIVGQITQSARITIRKNLSYCPILLDDNNRRTICRLHFNRSQKYLGLFDEDRNETRVPIDTIEDILSYANQLQAAVHFLDTGKSTMALKVEPVAPNVMQRFSHTRLPTALPQSKILSRGANISLTQLFPNIKQINVTLSWDIVHSNLEIDSSAFLLDRSGKVLSDDHFIFFNNLVSPDGAVQLLDYNETEQAQNQQIFQITLGRIDDNIEKIVFIVTIYEAEERKQNFGLVDDAEIRIVNPSNNQEIARYNPNEDFSLETAMIFGELYRHRQDWKFRAVGQGFEGGLEAMAKTFGVDTDE